MEERETPLQMVRRHLEDGERRIAAQEVLIVDLETGGRERELSLARKLLAQMHAVQAEGRVHLEYETKKARGSDQQDRR